MLLFDLVAQSNFYNPIYYFNTGIFVINLSIFLRMSYYIRKGIPVYRDPSGGGGILMDEIHNALPHTLPIHGSL